MSLFERLRRIVSDADTTSSETAPEINPGDLVVEVVKPLIESGEYRQYLDQWAAAGFHIRPDIYQIEREPFSTDAAESIVAQFQPNLLILGAAKSGTFTVHMYLDAMPDVCMSEPKEPYFFECEFDLGMEHYRQKYFSHWLGERWIGESRHRNLYLPYVPPRLHATNPDAKLIVMVRNPVDRAYSHWWYWYSRQMEPLSFATAIQVDYDRLRRGTPVDEAAYCAGSDASGKGIHRTYLDSGYYAEQIERYLEYFPRQQLKVMLLEDLAADPFAFVQDLQAFIGIDHYTADTFEPLHVNAAKEDDLTQPPMHPQVRAWLREHYAPHNQRLAALIGRDLSHWNA